MKRGLPHGRPLLGARFPVGCSGPHAPKRGGGRWCRSAKETVHSVYCTVKLVLATTRDLLPGPLCLASRM